MGGGGGGGDLKHHAGMLLHKPKVMVISGTISVGLPDPGSD